MLHKLSNQNVPVFEKPKVHFSCHRCVSSWLIMSFYCSGEVERLECVQETKQNKVILDLLHDKYSFSSNKRLL